MNLENTDFEEEWKRFRKAVGLRRFHIYADGDVVSHLTTVTEDGYKDEFYCNVDIHILKIWLSMGLIRHHSRNNGYHIVIKNA